MSRPTETLQLEPVLLPVPEARQIALDALVRIGLPQDQAEVIADHLIDAAMCGYPFAGLPRIIALREAIRARPAPTPIRIEHQTPLSAVLDGGNNPGYVAVLRAADLAIEKAGAHGFAIVAVNNSFLSGRNAYYVERIAGAGLIGIHTVASLPNVAPYGGREPVLGTNPFSIAVPCRDRPIVLDIGTSAITAGEVQLAARTGAALPSGVAIDSDGRPTVDGAAALAGAILPFGGHKGFGLSFMVQALGLLSGSFAKTGVPNDFGFVHIAIAPSLMMNADDYTHQVELLAEKVRATAPLGDDPVRVPSDRAAQRREHSRQHGIEVDRAVLRALEQLT